MECQVSILESDVSFTIHIWNARCPAWNLYQVYLLASIYGMSGVNPGI